MTDNMTAQIHKALNNVTTRPAGYAYLGRGDNSGVIVADPNRRTCWTYTLNQPPVPVPLVTSLNILVVNRPEMEGTRVQLGYPPQKPNVLHIVDFDYGEGLDSVGGITPEEQFLAASKYVDSGSLINLRGAPNDPADGEVYINPGWYITDSGKPGWWGGDSSDTLCTTARAALGSGEHQMAVLVIDGATGLPGIALSPAEAGGVNDKQVFDNTTIADMTFADNLTPAVAVHLYFGQTVITEDDIYRSADPRIVFRNTGASTGMSDFEVAGDSGTPFDVENGDTLTFEGANGIEVLVDDGTQTVIIDGADLQPPFTDTTAIVKGSADATKLLRFEVDDFTTATTRVVTVPDADLTMVGTTTIQTLTSKKFDDGVTINEAGGNSDTRIEGDNEPNLIVVDASADAVGFGTATPSNKTVIDVVSTTRAARPIPSMTTLERLAISSPVSGSKVFDTDYRASFVYTGVNWALDVLTYACDTYLDSNVFGTGAGIQARGNGRVAVYNGTSWETHPMRPNLYLGILADVGSVFIPVIGITNGSPTATIPGGLGFLLCAGMRVSGSSIPGGTTIASVDSNSQITLSANATGTDPLHAVTFNLAVSKMYDVFVGYQAAFDQLAYNLAAWTNDTTRATALTTQDGFLVKTGDTTKRYVGSFRTDDSGLFVNTVLQRCVYSHYNQQPRLLWRYDDTNSWAYTSTTIRQANASTANQVEVVVGLDDTSLIDLTIYGIANTSNASIGVGRDTTTAYSAGDGGKQLGMRTIANVVTPAHFAEKVPLGYHVYSWNEAGIAGNSFVGDGGVANLQSGMRGIVWS